MTRIKHIKSISSEREGLLRDRLAAIDSVLREVGLCVDESGEVAPVEDFTTPHWTLLLVGFGLLGFPYLRWAGGLILLVSALASLNRWEHEIRVSLNKLRIAEYRREVESIREELFGGWAKFYPDLVLLDVALASAVQEKGALFFGEGGAFSCEIEPDSYQITLRVSPSLFEGKAILRVEGRLKDDPEDKINPKRYILVRIDVSNGDDFNCARALYWAGPDIGFAKFLEAVGSEQPIKT